MTRLVLKRVSSIFNNNWMLKNSAFVLNSCSCFVNNISQTRRKHWSQESSKEKGEKVIKVILPEVNEYRSKEKLTVEEIRSFLKEKGVAPHKNWKEKPIYISCTNGIADPYVPPKGDGKVSFIPEQNVKHLYDVAKGKSFTAVKKIQNIDLSFDLPVVAEKAKDLYIGAQKALAERNEDKLKELVTEKAFEEMMEAIRLKTIRWNFIQSLEPPRIVLIRCQEMISKHNIFAQVTVRLFSQQTLAVYDRFGRLEQGSEETCKDVLEYVVLEKHITNPHGTWKIHGKIIPNWTPNVQTCKELDVKENNS